MLEVSSAFNAGEPRLVAKEELLQLPLLGIAMRRCGHIHVDSDKVVFLKSYVLLPDLNR